ncbi:Uncharacterised protein [Mycobacteroides abscessus subsp. abscessus]|nr:Uncharacterised protein [Mycobacteroides abscessus subsp. abscessus]SKU47246.1 Uncharacterised protein [Mycobacteroides abscessus subsp. abscessus]
MRKASNSASVRQRNVGVEPPTPRGSNPTMSKLCPIAESPSLAPIPAARSTPDPPGPPGLTRSAPTRLPVAGTLSTASSATAPISLS